MTLWPSERFGDTSGMDVDVDVDDFGKIGQNSCCAECDDDSNSEFFEFSEKKNENTSTLNVPERDGLYSAFEEAEDSKVFAAR